MAEIAVAPGAREQVQGQLALSLWVCEHWPLSTTSRTVTMTPSPQKWGCGGSLPAASMWTTLPLLVSISLRPGDALQHKLPT